MAADPPPVHSCTSRSEYCLRIVKSCSLPNAAGGRGSGWCEFCPTSPAAVAKVEPPVSLSQCKEAATTGGLFAGSCLNNLFRGDLYLWDGCRAPFRPTPPRRIRNLLPAFRRHRLFGFWKNNDFNRFRLHILSTRRAASRSLRSRGLDLRQRLARPLQLLNLVVKVPNHLRYLHTVSSAVRLDRGPLSILSHSITFLPR